MKKLTLVTFLLFSLQPTFSFAWTGYDNFDGSEIEISSGNLVREGEEIVFYDWESEESRSAEVRKIEYLFNRTEVEVYDYIAKKIRIFDMEN
ncbi:MAG: hypothetical protein ACJAW3_000458 [Lentimonas sp.]|jgi:hypothetical protein